MAIPIIKLLRLCDNQAMEVLGKINFHMYQSGEAIIKKLGATISLAREALRFHTQRWEYQHSRMDAATYALDPELMHGGDAGSLVTRLPPCLG